MSSAFSDTIGTTTRIPFKHSLSIHNELTTDLQRIKHNATLENVSDVQMKLEALYKWMSTAPTNIVYRVNISKYTLQDVIEHLQDDLTQYTTPPCIRTIPEFPEVIIVHGWDESIKLNLDVYSKEVIVDAACGVAVLRGSHVFAPGVMALSHGLTIGDVVSVYADIGNCKKGMTKPHIYNNKLFLGNGVIKQTRDRLFCNNAQNVSGIAVHMTDVISRLPQLRDSSVPEGSAFLQNLPSIICSHVLNPQPGEVILDMCAAPGNKTTHISNLMKGRGTLIALEKNKSKIQKLKSKCEKFSAGNVKVFSYDSTKAASGESTRLITDGPPFEENSFDRILLDSPCSGLGQRPQLFNLINVAELRSYVPLQRKLFSAAVRLLKPNGILVYSTCTITIAENEGIVSWALRTFPELQLLSVNDQIKSTQYGTQGYCIDGLSEELSNKVCRFGPESNSVGFFIACFTKHT